MKFIAALIIGLLMCNSLALAGQTPSAASTSTEALHAEKMKTEVQKRGIGEKSRVKIKLANGKQVKGYISGISDLTFAVEDKKTGQATTIAFADTQKVQGPGLPTGVKVGIVAGVVVVVIVVVVASTVEAKLAGGA
jgi:hypothetical protein